MFNIRFSLVLLALSASVALAGCRAVATGGGPLKGGAAPVQKGLGCGPTCGDHGCNCQRGCCCDPVAHPRCNAFGGGAISFALPTVQFPGFFRVPTVRQGLVPFMEPNVVVAQQQPVAPLVVAQGGGSSLEQQLLLAQLLALQQAQQKKNSGAEAAPAQTEKGAVDAETLKTIERLENMVEQLESQLQQSQQRPDQQGQLRALPMTAPVSHIQPAVLLTPANMTRLPASY